MFVPLISRLQSPENVGYEIIAAISYNLLPQLFRIQHFLGFEDAKSVERTFCTYFRKKDDEKIKRMLKTNFVSKVLNNWNHFEMTSRLIELDSYLRSTHVHSFRMPDYINHSK